MNNPEKTVKHEHTKFIIIITIITIIIMVREVKGGLWYHEVDFILD